MSEKSLRGTRLGSNSLESEVGVEPVERHVAEYHCPEGHVFSVPFAFDAEIPALWQCKCGAEALLVDADPPGAPRRPSRPAPTGTCCWSAARSPSSRSCSTSGWSCCGPSRARPATSAAPESVRQRLDRLLIRPAPGTTAAPPHPVGRPFCVPDSRRLRPDPGPIWSVPSGGSTSGRVVVDDDLALHDGRPGRPGLGRPGRSPRSAGTARTAGGPAAGSAAGRRAARAGPGRSRAGSSARPPTSSMHRVGHLPARQAAGPAPPAAAPGSERAPPRRTTRRPAKEKPTISSSVGHGPISRATRTATAISTAITSRKLSSTMPRICRGCRRGGSRSRRLGRSRTAAGSALGSGRAGA